MVEATGLKLLYRGSLEWHHLPTKSHENLPSGSKVDERGGTHTDRRRQVGDLISLFPFVEVG
jgi:hypothetical protein